MEAYWDLIKEIVRESDIVLEILDARAVDVSRNEQLEKIIKEHNRPRIFVLNKMDLVVKEDLEIPVSSLKEEGEVVYVSAKDKRSIRILIARIKKVFSEFGKRKEFYTQPILKKPYREAKGDIVIGVLGYPNVGKSSIINALAFKKKVNVSSKAGTTHGVHWIKAGGKIGEQIKLIDTPGVIPLKKVDESGLALIASRNPEKLKEPEVAAARIIQQFIKENKVGKLEELYGLKIEEKEDPYAMMAEIAKVRGHLKRGGIADEVRMSINIIHDWQKGKLRL